MRKNGKEKLKDSGNLTDDDSNSQNVLFIYIVVYL